MSIKFYWSYLSQSVWWLEEPQMLVWKLDLKDVSRNSKKYCNFMLLQLQNLVKKKERDQEQILTFLYTFTDTVRFLEEVVMVALATTIQEVLALTRVLVIIPAREGAFTGSYDWSCSTWIYRERVRHSLILHIWRVFCMECTAETISWLI